MEAPMSKTVFNDRAMIAFGAHLALFLLVVGAAAALNFYATPDRIWFIWVLAGWGIAVAAHALLLLLQRTHRRERIFIDPKARAAIVHLFAYLAVVLLLFVVNYTATPNVWWFYWVALGWGAGVAAHLWCVFWKHRRRPPQQAAATPIPAKSQSLAKSRSPVKSRSTRATPKRTGRERK
jgi:2TM domain-containing protein